MPIQNVKIGGKDVKNVREVHLEMERAEDPQGKPGSFTQPAEIALICDPTNEGNTAGFAALTNGDGSLRFVSLAFEEADGAGNVKLKFETKEAFVEDWTLEGTNGRHTSLAERIVLRSGKFSLNIDGKPVSVNLRNWQIPA